MDKNAKAILDFIVQNRTFEQQLEQAIEEASEFILAAQKWKRYRGDTEWENLLEETADVRICMEQMRWYTDHTAVDSIVAEKLEREKRRILDGDKEAYGRK